MAYFKSNESAEPLNVICLFNATVRVFKDDEKSFHLQTEEFSRRLIAADKISRRRWVQAIRNNATTSYRYQSFAPIRRNITAAWYVNGGEYFPVVLEAFERAQQRIFIADWYLSPGVFLKRGEPWDKQYRLDHVVLAAAKRGVDIYILIWNNSTVAFDLQAKYVVSYMAKLCPGKVHAVSHPPWDPILWSHHQKFVVIDDQIAFLGGIDLCYTRFEDQRYLLTDVEGKIFPGRDYINLNLKGETNGPPWEDVVDRKAFPRTPWHDIHCSVDGEAAYDVAFNFIQRWNHAIKTGNAASPKLLLPVALEHPEDRRAVSASASLLAVPLVPLPSHVSSTDDACLQESKSEPEMKRPKPGRSYSRLSMRNFETDAIFGLDCQVCCISKRQ